MSHTVSIGSGSPVGEVATIGASLLTLNAMPQVPRKARWLVRRHFRLLAVLYLIAGGCGQTEPDEVISRVATIASEVHAPNVDSDLLAADGVQPAIAVSLDPERQELIDRRAKLLAAERQQQFPVEPESSPEEVEANRRLCALRLQEIRKYKADNTFPAATPFSEAKPLIEQSQVFAILKRMPKGGALHLHSSAAGRLDWLVPQCLQREDCHVCWPDDVYQNGNRVHQKGEIRFCGPNSVPTGFKQLKAVAASTPGFETTLRQFFSLGPGSPVVADRWAEFNSCFARLGSVLANEPLFTAYFADAFSALAEDGVDYVELRSGFPQLYANDGQPKPTDQAIVSYQAALAVVREKHPNFDFRVIVSDWRGADISRIVESFRNTVRMQKKYPGLVVGYDLVGKEDDAGPTAHLINVWPVLRQVCRDEGVEFPVLFLHDGESNWADDQNLIDAHLVQARRIGHGLDLYLFPALEDTFRREEIALEVCPISNQILGYVSDLRAHPANGYIRRGVPCVLSSDDPLILGYDGLTYDYWVAFMAWNLDLVTIRQLVLNTITYSARTDTEKAAAEGRFREQWQKFVRMINNELPEPAGLDCQ